MEARFLVKDDPRLNEVADFKIETISEDYEINYEVIKTEWIKGMTFNKIFDILDKRHTDEGGIGFTVLETGGKLWAVVDSETEVFKHHYVVIKRG